MTSVRKRLDHVLFELDMIGSDLDEETANNVVAQLYVINGAFRETERAPMCCFKYDAEKRVICDVIGPLPMDDFMKKCKQCQKQIKKVLSNLKTD